MGAIWFEDLWTGQTDRFSLIAGTVLVVVALAQGIDAIRPGKPLLRVPIRDALPHTAYLPFAMLLSGGGVTWGAGLLLRAPFVAAVGTLVVVGAVILGGLLIVILGLMGRLRPPERKNPDLRDSWAEDS